MKTESSRTEYRKAMRQASNAARLLLWSLAVASAACFTLAGSTGLGLVLLAAGCAAALSA